MASASYESSLVGGGTVLFNTTWYTSVARNKFIHRHESRENQRRFFVNTAPVALRTLPLTLGQEKTKKKKKEKTGQK